MESAYRLDAHIRVRTEFTFPTILDGITHRVPHTFVYKKLRLFWVI